MISANVPVYVAVERDRLMDGQVLTDGIIDAKADDVNTWMKLTIDK